MGVLPTTPEGALRDERVDPSTQEDQRIDQLDRDAIRKGWSVPEHAKAKVIERLLEPFWEEPVTVEDRDGNPVTIPPDRHLLKENAKVLVMADKSQWERDHPKEAGQARGSVNVSQQVAVGFDWDKLTGEEVVDPVEAKLREIEQQPAMEGADHEGSDADLPRGVPADDGPQDPKEGQAGHAVRDQVGTQDDAVGPGRG